MTSREVTGRMIEWRVNYLQQDVVNGRLHFKAQSVAGVVAVQDKLVVDVEVRHGRNRSVLLRSLLVVLALLNHLALQLFKISPTSRKKALFALHSKTTSATFDRLILINLFMILLEMFLPVHWASINILLNSIAVRTESFAHKVLSC